MQPAAEAIASAFATADGEELQRPPLDRQCDPPHPPNPVLDEDQEQSHCAGYRHGAMARDAWRLQSWAARASMFSVSSAAGKVLSGLLRRNAPDALALAFATPEDIRVGAVILKEKANAV